MLKTIKKYHARAVPAIVCFLLAASVLAASPHAIYMGLGLILVGTVTLFIPEESK